MLPSMRLTVLLCPARYCMSSDFCDTLLFTAAATVRSARCHTANTVGVSHSSSWHGIISRAGKAYGMWYYHLPAMYGLSVAGGAAASLPSPLSRF